MYIHAVSQGLRSIETHIEPPAYGPELVLAVRVGVIKRTRQSNLQEVTRCQGRALRTDRPKSVTAPHQYTLTRRESRSSMKYRWVVHYCTSPLYGRTPPTWKLLECGQS